MIINKDVAVFNILLISIMLYYAQQALGLRGIVGPVLLPIIMLISLAYVIRVMVDPTMRTGFIWLWFIFIVHNVVNFIATADYSDVNLLRSVLLNFLPFFPFYYFTKKNVLTREKLILFLIIMLPLFVIQLQQSTSTLQIEKGKDDVTDNTIYLFIGLLPFVFLFKKKLTSIFFLMVILYFVIESNKRAAIVAWFFAASILFVKDVYIEKYSKKLPGLFTSTVVAVIVIPFAYELYIANETLVYRVELMLDGHSSGRDLIIFNVINAWINSNSYITYFLGFGYNSTERFTHAVSHNDWVDVLGSFGLLGFFLYLAIFTKLIMSVFSNGLDRDKRVMIFLFVGLALLVSMTSRWYWAGFAYMNFLILPYLLATKYEKLKQQ